MIAVMRPLGEMVIRPLRWDTLMLSYCGVVQTARGFEGETRVVTEATGNYHLPVASFALRFRFYVSVVNAMLWYMATGTTVCGG